jgi:hypothetical protein
MADELTDDDVYRGRSNMREDNFNKAMEAKVNGDNEKAEVFFQRSISITFEMVQMVISALKQHNIKYMIAPYEADAQLAFLSMNNLVDAVITEDSDVLIYGCRRVIYKLDRNSGIGHEIYRRDLGRNKDMNFQGWTDEQFVTFCCLVGCDYCPNLHGMGIKTAHKYVSGNRTFNDIIKALKTSWKTPADITYDFIVKLWRAYMTFRHQTIYNPLVWKMKHLRDMGEETMRKHIGLMKKCYPSISDLDANDLNFLGAILADDIAERLVRGYISPATMISTTTEEAVVESTKITEEEAVEVGTGTKITWISTKETMVEKASLPPYASTTAAVEASSVDQEEKLDIWAFSDASVTSVRRGEMKEMHVSSTSMRMSVNVKQAEDYQSELVSSSFESIQRKKRRLKDLEALNAAASHANPTSYAAADQSAFFDVDDHQGAAVAQDMMIEDEDRHVAEPAYDLAVGVRASSPPEVEVEAPFSPPRPSPPLESDLMFKLLPSSHPRSSVDKGPSLNEEELRPRTGLWPILTPSSSASATACGGSSSSSTSISRSAINELKKGILEDLDQLPFSSSGTSTTTATGFHIVYDLPSPPLPTASSIRSTFSSSIRPQATAAAKALPIPYRRPIFTSIPYPMSSPTSSTGILPAADRPFDRAPE